MVIVTFKAPLQFGPLAFLEESNRLKEVPFVFILDRNSPTLCGKYGKIQTEFP